MADYNITKYSLMRVTQTERPFSVLEIKIPQKIVNDENDSMIGNMPNSRFKVDEQDRQQRNQQ
jgi:hypothetical protein